MLQTSALSDATSGNTFNLCYLQLRCCLAAAANHLAAAGAAVMELSNGRAARGSQGVGTPWSCRCKAACGTASASGCPSTWRARQAVRQGPKCSCCSCSCCPAAPCRAAVRLGAATAVKADAEEAQPAAERGTGGGLTSYCVCQLLMAAVAQAPSLSSHLSPQCVQHGSGTPMAGYMVSDYIMPAGHLKAACP